MDDAAHDLIGQIRQSVDYLRQLKRIPTREDLEEAFIKDPTFLDVCWLFSGKGQEPMAHIICDEIGQSRMNWSNLRKLASREPHLMADIMTSLGIDKIIGDHLNRKWEVEDVLIERYNLSSPSIISLTTTSGCL